MPNELIKRAYSESEYTPEFLNLLNETKYVKIYFSLIEKALNRETLTGYVEHHHFIPESLGGIKTVPLTPREHFLAHLLLTKMLADPTAARKMKFAFNMMLVDKYGNRHKPSSRWYETARNNLREAMRGRTVSIETRKKIGDIHRGKILSEETRKKISQSNLGKSVKISEEHAKKIGNALRDKPKTDLHKEKLSLAKLGKKGVPRTEEWKKKIGETNKARWAERKNNDN